MSWTDERIETLTRMWSAGQSASQIAKELGGVTRNAVIGKVHRLGLSNRNETDAVATNTAAATETTQTQPKAKAAPKEKPASKPAPTAKAETAPKVKPPVTEPPDPEPVTQSAQPAFVARRSIVPAGQPLPPQPSANEISPEALATVREVEKKARKLSLMELTERTCKWPIGDPATEKFWFCGLPSQAGKPYCEAHVGVAFQPMSSRRDRRR